MVVRLPFVRGHTQPFWGHCGPPKRLHPPLRQILKQRLFFDLAHLITREGGTVGNLVLLVVMKNTYEN